MLFAEMSPQGPAQKEPRRENQCRVKKEHPKPCLSGRGTGPRQLRQEKRNGNRRNTSLPKNIFCCILERHCQIVACFLSIPQFCSRSRWRLRAMPLEVSVKRAEERFWMPIGSAQNDLFDDRSPLEFKVSVYDVANDLNISCNPDIHP